MKERKLICPKCNSTNIVKNPLFDDQSQCLDCEYNGFTEDSIYGKGFLQDQTETDEARKRELLIKNLDDHNCRLLEIESCDCIDLRIELARLNFKTNNFPYKYNPNLGKGKKLLGLTEKEQERLLWEEIREDRL